MNIKKLMGLTILTLGTANFNISAQAVAVQDTTINDVSVEVLEYILDFIYHPYPEIPASYLRNARALVALAQTSRACRQLSLVYTERGVINRLIKFDESTAAINLSFNNDIDFVSACFAFKIISKIRAVATPNFCAPQYHALRQFLHNHTYNPAFDPLKRASLDNVKWIVSENSRVPQLEVRFRSLCQEYTFHAILNEWNVDRYDDEFGMTVLIAAVVRNDIKFVQLLLAAGANANVIVNVDNSHLRPCCVLSLDPSLVRMHNIRRDIARGSLPRGATALHIATAFGNNLIVAELLNAVVQATIDARMSSEVGMGPTALHLAVARNNLELVRMLLDAGANPTLSYVDGRGVVMTAESLTDNPEIRQTIREACEKWRSSHPETK